VGDSPLWGQLGPKAIGWKELVTVIVLDDLSHCLEGHGIGAELIGTHVVQGGRLQRIPCRDMGPSLMVSWVIHEFTCFSFYASSPLSIYTPSIHVLLLLFIWTLNCPYVYSSISTFCY
jgi:hypothetical protein